MKRKKIAVMLIILLLFQTNTIGTPTAYAKMKVGTAVALTQPEQILESITYLGVTVEAAYTNGPYSGSDPIYSCAAFVKKFYSKVYGIGVYNLISKDSVPMISNHQGSFSMTTQPQPGDMIRDNTRTHWAIVKSVDGDVITVVQQNYRSGNTAWINCTIDRYDPDYTYFTYSGRMDDSTKETGDASPVPGSDTASEIPQGTYRLAQAADSSFLGALEAADDWRVTAGSYQDSNSQMLSIVSSGGPEYTLQFLSNQRFLAVSDTKQLSTSLLSEQKFIFVLRDNGYYTISPTANRNQVIACQADPQQNGQSELVLRDYTGSMNEFWYLGMVSTSVLELTPGITVDKKTLYQGYQDFTIGLTRLKSDAVITYTSDHPEVAEVSSTGVVSPRSPGKAVVAIQVIQNNQIYPLKIDIVVKEPYVKILTTKKQIPVGGKIEMKAKKYGTDSDVSWNISDRTIAEINTKSSTLIAKKRGTVTVTVKTKDGLKAKLKLTII